MFLCWSHFGIKVFWSHVQFLKIFEVNFSFPSSAIYNFYSDFGLSLRNAEIIQKFRVLFDELFHFFINYNEMKELLCLMLLDTA